jgi:hypothetical protein
LWRVDRKGDGWDDPKQLPVTINQGTSVFSPSIAADGSLYFMRAEPQDLSDEVNEAGSNIEARLGPDHRTLYFSTNTVPPVSSLISWANGRENIWYVSLASWLDGRGHGNGR